ncbi:hypothetical protein KOW79_004420 [Hemibagrus wyckioides]|uniref:Uncharacterized protein n=1 Tax=Hemibagrus wyckioides TaxID=337641 RepID=A0A9D3SPN8_9TELE|nr:hypothetical protein KOW79_004420 [Hemibagrus wyckioides]
MGNSQSRDSKKSEDRRSSRCGPAGASTLDPAPDQRQRCFRDILDLVLQLSDEEWKAVSRDMEKEVSRLEFASDCSEILTTSLSAVIQHLLKPLRKSFGIEAILEANDKLKKMESKLSKCSSSDTSAQSSPAEASDFICELSQRIVTEIKSAMLGAIRSMASGQRPSCSARASSSVGDPISPLDDLSIACTNEICERILALYLSEEGVRPGGETSSRQSLKSHQEVNGIMKGLEEVDPSRSSSWSTVKILISEIVSNMPTDGALSAPQGERPFSDQFMSKATQVVSEVLQKTEQKLAASVLPQTSIHASSETELNFLMDLVRSSVALENIQSTAAGQFLNNDILVKKLSSYFSTGLISEKGSRSSRASSLRSSVDLDRVAFDIIKSVINGAALDFGLFDVENGMEAWVGEAQVSDADAHSAPYSMSSSGFSSKLQSLFALEDQKSVQQVIDADRKPLPSAQNRPYVSCHILNVVRDRLKAFFISSTTSAADDKRTDASVSDGDRVVPIHICDNGMVHELTEPDNLSPEEMIRQRAHDMTDTIANLLLRNVAKTRNVVRSASDSALDRGNSSVQFTQFPYELVYMFVEQSTKTLVQNVLNAGFSGDTEIQESCSMNKSINCASTPALWDHETSLMWSLKNLYSKSSQQVSAGSSSLFPRAAVEENLEHQNVIDEQNQPGPSSHVQGSDGGSLYSAAENQERKRQLGFRFIVKKKTVVIRRPKNRRRSRVPVQRVVQPTSDAQSRTSRALFKNTRRTLSRIFSNIFKTFTCCFIPDTALGQAPELREETYAVF